MIPGEFVDKLAALMDEGFSLSSDDYRVFTLKTKNNKVRQICEPKEALKIFQKKCADTFNYLPTSLSCHSKPGSSTVHNALPHVNSQVIYKTDIADFYPTIEILNVGIGYRGVATDNVSENFYYATTSWVSQIIDLCFTKHTHGLPTGAPSSPALSNIAMYRADKDLDSLCEAHGYIYTRYFDDLTFSKKHGMADISFSEEVSGILENYGFKIRDDKSKWVLPNTHEAFEVTGINIGNGKSTVPRPIKRLVRSMLDREAKGTLETREVLDGYLAYINMVDKEYRDKLDNYFQERIIHHANKHT